MIVYTGILGALGILDRLGMLGPTSTVTLSGRWLVSEAPGRSRVYIKV